MHLPQRQPASSRRRLTGAIAALPLLLASFLSSPAQAAPDSIIASGIYNSSGEGCQGSGTSTDCLSWGLRIPSTIAPKKELTVTVEVDSVPGQWAWNCLANDRVAGTASFYDAPIGGESKKLSNSDLRRFARLHYKIDDLVRVEGSYLDLSFGTTTTTPGSGQHTYSFSPTVTTSADNTPQKITATVQKPAANAAPH